MPTDLQDLMKYIGDLHNQEMERLSELNGNFSEFKGRIEAKVSSLEDDNKEQSRRQWYHSVAVTALAFANHIGHTMFGWRF